MAKDILLFLDGTRNRSSHRWDGVATNVWKVFDAVASKNLPGGPDARYVRGIASNSAPPPLSDLAASLPAKAKWHTALAKAVRDLVMAGRYVPNQFESATGWGMSVFPDKVKQALLKVDDLTVRLHIACVLASSTRTAEPPVASEVAAGLAAIPANWASARYQVAIRNASALVRRRLPTMRWDAVDGAKLADAVVLLAVFNRSDVVESALRRIRHNALGWERLARNPRYQRPTVAVRARTSKRARGLDGEDAGPCSGSIFTRRRVCSRYLGHREPSVEQLSCRP